MIIKSAGLIFKNGKLLAVKKKNNDSHYILPGGKVDDGETKEEALVRELKEELNITVGYDSFSYLVDIYSTAQFENIPLLSHIFLVQIDEEINIANEIGSYTWLDLENFNEEEMTDTMLKVIEYIKVNKLN